MDSGESDCAVLDLLGGWSGEEDLDEIATLLLLSRVVFGLFCFPLASVHNGSYVVLASGVQVCAKLPTSKLVTC